MKRKNNSSFQCEYETDLDGFWRSVLKTNKNSPRRLKANQFLSDVFEIKCDDDIVLEKTKNNEKKTNERVQNDQSNTENRTRECWCDSDGDVILVEKLPVIITIEDDDDECSDVQVPQETIKTDGASKSTTV